MNIYYTGNNLEEIKSLIKNSNLTVVETDKGIVIVNPDGSPQMLNMFDVFINTTADGGYTMFSKQTQVEMIAALCHEANAAICRCNSDELQSSWRDAPDWQRKSCINGVLMHLLDPAASPSKSHENWMKEKIEDGWVYGERKDEELKTHPCIVDYDDLDKSQQVKDYVFKAIVNQQSKLSFPGLDLQLAKGK